MFTVIRGVKPRRQWIGYTVAWCPIRRELAHFRVLRCGVARHLYYLHVGATQWSHYELVCPDTSITLTRRFGVPLQLMKTPPPVGSDLAALASDAVLGVALRNAEHDNTTRPATSSERIASVVFLLQEADRGVTRPHTYHYLLGTAIVIGVVGLLVAVGLGASRSWIAIPVGAGAVGILGMLGRYGLRESPAARFRRMRRALMDAIGHIGATHAEVSQAVEESRRQRTLVAPMMERAMRMASLTGGAD